MVDLVLLYILCTSIGGFLSLLAGWAFAKNTEDVAVPAIALLASFIAFVFGGFSVYDIANKQLESTDLCDGIEYHLLDDVPYYVDDNNELVECD